jgi:hypothetical protein
MFSCSELGHILNIFTWEFFSLNWPNKFKQAESKHPGVVFNTSLSHLLETQVRLNRQHVIYHWECSQPIFVIDCRQFISCGGVQTTQDVYRTLGSNQPASLFSAETRETVCVVQKYLKFSVWGPGGQTSRQFHNTVGSSCPQKKTVQRLSAVYVLCFMRTESTYVGTTYNSQSSDPSQAFSNRVTCVIFWGGQENVDIDAMCYPVKSDYWYLHFTLVQQQEAAPSKHLTTISQLHELIALDIYFFCIL